MSIITLTTDYGIKDHFVASVKGAVLTAISDAQIIDISHCIDLYNIANASYVLLGAYKKFPKNSVHMVLVEAEMFDQTSFLLIKLNNQFIITANNGTLSLLASEDENAEIINLDIPNHCADTHSLYIFVAEKVLKQQQFKELGTAIAYADCEELVELKVKVADDANAIRGSIIYEDHYGNAVTNITKDLFERIRNKRKFVINASRYKVNRINEYYADFNTEVKSIREYEGDMMFIFNDLGFLQMSIYKSNPSTIGNVRSLFGLTYRDAIIIEFID